MSRFQVSPFKNVQANLAKKEDWHTELPLNTASLGEGSDGIKATENYAIARGQQSGSLLFLPLSHPGKHGQKAPTWSCSGKAISDFDTSLNERLLAVGSEDGRISVAQLPETVDASETSLSLDSVSGFSSQGQKGVDVVQFHPTSSGILLSSQGSTVSVWNTKSSSSDSLYSIQGPAKGFWHASWSRDGRLVQTAGKDNAISMWDIRQSASAPSATCPGHQGFNKASRIVSIGELVLTTGFTKTRDREVSLWDPRNFTKAVSNTRIDTNTGVLMPLVDHSRRIAYLAGRSDMVLRWVEITGASQMTLGGANLPIATTGACLLPSTSSTLDVMKGQITRLALLSNDGMIPVTMQVPRRTYLDFHADLYPMQETYLQPAQSGDAWLGGGDEQKEMALPQPNKEWGRAQGIGAVKAAPPKASAVKQGESVSDKPAVTSSTAGSVTVEPATATREATPSTPAEAPAAQTPASKSATGDGKPINQVAAQLSKASLEDKSPNTAASAQSANAVQPAPSTTAVPSPTPAKQNGTSSTSPSPANPQAKAATSTAASPNLGKPFNPQWSRAYLTGKTALKPEYDDVHGVASTLNASIQLLKANATYLFYPLAGPGGRLAVHPVKATGRLPLHPAALSAGSDILDFTLDPFDDSKVYVACTDGKIRAFSMPADGLAEGSEHGEVTVVLADGMDKVSEISHHPLAANVLLSTSEDAGEGVVRVWDALSGDVIAKAKVPGKGFHSAAWDESGTYVAVTCKDKKLRILDPRKPDTIYTGTGHDSVRPSKVVWASANHLLTTGFNRSAFREILLHKLDISTGKLETVSKVSLDVSPAPLFPVYDRDTHILYTWSKGERTVHAYEVKPDSTPPALAKLPSFEHGSLQSALSFLPKRALDVTKVEVARCYRLTPSSIQLVSFTIPRAKLDFFQDDVYPPTLDTSHAALSSAEYASGKTAQPAYFSLRPAGMPLLSEAPAAPKREKQVVMQKQMSKEQQEQAYLDSLFREKQARHQKEMDDAEEDEMLGLQRNARRNYTEVDDDDDW